MCKVDATLSYGILVRAISLCIAAKQWDYVKPSLLALDMIKARRSAGTLKVEDEKGVFVKLPVEVLELIKNYVIEEGAKAVETEYVREAHAGGVKEWGNRKHDVAPDVIVHGWTYEHYEQCFFCQRTFEDSHMLLKEFETDVDMMLIDFRLKLQDENPASWLDASTMDPSALFLVGLLPPGWPQDEGDAEDCWIKTSMPILHGHHDSSQSLLTFCPSFFQVPRDADKRFHRLFTSGLKVVTGSFSSTGRLPYKDVMADLFRGEPAPQETTQDTAGHEVSTDTPRWMLWQTGVDHGMF